MVYHGSLGGYAKAIAKAGLSIQDMDLFEINEAFSVVALVNEQKLELPS